jgi:DNA polymerase III epsilon subunit-like protein
VAIQRKTYLDVPPSVRKDRAGVVQTQLRGILSDAAATNEMREFAQKQLGVLSKWVSGDLPTEVEGALNYHALSEVIDQAKEEKATARRAKREEEQAAQKEARAAKKEARAAKKEERRPRRGAPGVE